MNIWLLLNMHSVECGRLALIQIIGQYA